MTEHESPTGPQPCGPSLNETSTDSELAAERAAVAYWRTVAGQRRIEASRVQHRPLVRAAIALDRRTSGLQEAATRGSRNVGAQARRAAIRTQGWASRASLRSRRVDLNRQYARLANPEPASPQDQDESPLVIHLGPPPATDPGDLNALVANATAPLVCILGPHTQPAEVTWLRRLVQFVAADPQRRAATPLVLHPQRPWAEATADDLQIRWAGLSVAVSADGTPVPVARHHGTTPDLARDDALVAAAASSALVMSRESFVEAGGLGPHADLDAAMVDLCLRHRSRGGTVHCVAASVVTDARPVTKPQQLLTPLDPVGAPWRSLVDDHGPALYAIARNTSAVAGLRIALTTAVPSAKMAHSSGDWHYAGLLAGALERAGHRVRRQTIDQAESQAGRACDLHLVLRGLEPVRRTVGQRHVLWVISHPEALEIAECDRADLVLVASARFAAHLRERTSTPVEVLLQATEPRHFRPMPPEPSYQHRVTVVANSRGVPRASVADAVAAELDPAVYGTGWEGLVDPDAIAASYAPFDQLPAVYSSAGVVLNDHWETMRHWGFVSNRIFDVAACATPIISDALPEVTELFGDLVPTWRDPAELRSVVEAIEANPAQTVARTTAARDLVLDHHTFDHRVQDLQKFIERHLPPTTSEDRR